MVFSDISIYGAYALAQAEEGPKDVGGRPHIQADNFLMGSLYYLVGAFEKGWCRVGWALMSIREAPELQTVGAVRRALEPMREFGQGVLCLLLSEPTTKEPLQLSDLRKNYEQAAKSETKARQVFERQAERCREATEALAQAAPAQIGLVEAEMRTREAEMNGLIQTLCYRQKEMAEIDMDLRQREVSFAQNEALDFLRHRRYELNPRNLAAAVADSPYTRWETSLLRCRQIGCVVTEHPLYSAFRAVSHLTKGERPQTAEEAILYFRERIPRLSRSQKHDYRQAKTFLARHWFQLKKAIEQEWNRCSNPRKLPYDLIAAFERNLDRPMTALDSVLAAQDRLEI